MGGDGVGSYEIIRSETVARVINGTYNMQKRWIEQHSLGWDKFKAQSSAQRMYDKIFFMKFLPPGRGKSHWCCRLFAKEANDLILLSTFAYHCILRSY